MGLQRLVGRTPAATLFDVCLDNQQRTNSCFCWPFFGITIRTAGLISLITVNWWHSETIESIKRTKWRSVDKNVPCFCELQFHDTSWREIPLLKNDFRKNTFLLSFFTSLVNACVYYYFYTRKISLWLNSFRLPPILNLPFGEYNKENKRYLFESKISHNYVRKKWITRTCCKTSFLSICYSIQHKKEGFLVLHSN